MKYNILFKRKPFSYLGLNLFNIMLKIRFNDTNRMVLLFTMKAKNNFL